MYSPLLQSIIEREGYQIVAEDDYEAKTGDGDVVLFFAGDAPRLAESDDVAVILPELAKAFEGIFIPYVVARESERQLQLKYHFNAYPALVFLRDGQFLGMIQKVQDWTDYITQIGDILQSNPSDPPRYKFPDGCGVSEAAGAN